jgi:WD40 repeat protein
MRIHRHFILLLLFIASSLFATKNNIIPGAKLSLQCSYNDEIIELAGLLNNQNSIKKIIELLEPATLSTEISTEPFIYRYPYDINYSDTLATWDTIVASTNFFQQKVQAITWFPDGNKLIVVGDTKAGSSGIVGRIYSFSENGSALYNDGKYTLTWGGLNSTSISLTTVAIHPQGSYFMIGGVRTPQGVTHRLVYLDENISSTIIVQDFDHGSTVRSIDWSPDGNYIAVAGETSSSINLRIYRFTTSGLVELPRCQFLWDATLPIYSVKWHPSGNFLLLSGGRNPGNKTLEILSFDHEALQLVQRLGSAGFVGHDPESIWSPDGTKGLTIHNSAALLGPVFGTFVNGLTFKDTYYGSITAHQFYSISISPDGAYYSVSRDNNIDTYSYYEDPTAGTGLNITTLNYAFATSRITKIRWNPDGNFLAFSAENGDIKVLKLNENQIVLAKRIKKELLNMYQPALQMYNTTQKIIQPLATANSNALVKYAAQTPITYTKTGTETFGGSNSMICMDWTLDNNYIIAAGDNNTLSTFLYKRNGNLLKVLQSLALIGPINSVRFSPNGKYIAIGSISPATTRILSFNGEYAKQLLSTATGGMHVEWFPDNATLLLNGAVYAFTTTALFALDDTFRKNASLDSTGRYFAYITNPNTLVVAEYKGNTVTTVTSTPVSLIASLDRVAWNTPSIIATWNAVSSLGVAIYQFNGTSLTLVGTSPISPINPQNESAISLDSTGDHFIVGRQLDGANLLEFATNAPLGPIVQIGSITNSGSFIFANRYSPDNNYIAATGTNGQRNAMLFTRKTTPPLMSLSSTYTIIKGTSDSITGYQSLIINNSTASIGLSSLATDNSNVLITKDVLIKANSNAVAGLLLVTSQAISNFVIQNSQAIVTKNNLIIANSFATINLSNVIQTNSNGWVTYQPLIINNSNATAGLLVATSNANAGLLVANSNAAAGLLVATSNATAELLINTSNAMNALALKALGLNTIDTGPSHVHFNSPTITMSYNLLLSTDHQLFVHASGVVNGNGHSITFARGAGTQMTIDPAITTTFQNVIFKDYNDASVVIGAGSSFIFGDDCRVELAEPQTLSRTWSFAGQSLLDGHNKNITLGTGNNFLSSLISSSLTIANLTLLNVRDNNIRAANNNAAIIFNNAQIYLSSDFTYSIGSMVINNDVTLRGTSIFNYSTIMGLTIASQSKLTIDQGCTFNYAPAGNFRNLLSFTDSSATLFFNNASLVATATGPRLINGTLLVDGVMQIQSSASSLAEGIIFGNGIPTNDLIIKIMPSATINLLSGYLHYANAQ